jgi:hypothetical protein
MEPLPRCGFCAKVVTGDVTATALPSEAFVVHQDAFVRGTYQGDHLDYEVFACAEGEGCGV